MIKETYKHNDTGKNITVYTKEQKINIGDKKYDLSIYEIERIKKLYKYNKKIFKEFIENIYTKYNIDMIDFFIANKITLKEIKTISNIVLFPIDFEVFSLSTYNIKIIDFFNYIYSQHYAFLSYDFINKYFHYLEENKKKLNKYNIFPHNLYLANNILNNNRIERNDKKDIIMDFYNFHLEFYGSKCEYYITYEGKRYNLLNDDERNLIPYDIEKNNNIYLSEYYIYDCLYNVIDNFEDKEYYTKTIKEDIFYLLKDNYKNMDRKEIDKLQKIILHNQNSFLLPKKNIFTNKFKNNLYILDYLTSFNLFTNIQEMIKTNNIYNNLFFTFLFLNNFYNIILNKKNKIIYKNDIEIIELNIFDFVTLINKNEYLNEPITNFFDSFIYLCIDRKSGDELFIYKFSPISNNKYIVKFLNREYSQDFLERIEDLQI